MMSAGPLPDLSAFFNFDSPAAGLLARAAISAPDTTAAVSPCTAAITSAAVAAMSSSPNDHHHNHHFALPTPSNSLSLPTDYYLPSFHEYDRRQYDLATNPEMRRQMRLNSIASSLSALMQPAIANNGCNNNNSGGGGSSEDDDMGEDGDDSPGSIPPALLASAANLDPARQAELRRQVHIQSEQKRRAQIKDGFEDLRRLLPNAHSKKMSKAVILSRTTSYLHQIKQHALQLEQEVHRLHEENARLRRAANLADNAVTRDTLFPM